MLRKFTEHQYRSGLATQQVFLLCSEEKEEYFRSEFELWCQVVPFQCLNSLEAIVRHKQSSQQRHVSCPLVGLVTYSQVNL